MIGRGLFVLGALPTALHTPRAHGWSEETMPVPLPLPPLTQHRDAPGCDSFALSLGIANRREKLALSKAELEDLTEDLADSAPALRDSSRMHLTNQKLRLEDDIARDTDALRALEGALFRCDVASGRLL